MYSHNINNNFYEMTADYLKNSRKSEKSFSLKQKVSEKDMNFYRKRILSITNDLLLKKQDQYLPLNINESFTIYITLLIDHFKLIDKNDLIQESLNILTNNDNISPNFEENKLQLHRDEKQQPLSDIKLINKLKNEKGKKHNKNLDDFVVKVVKNEKELLILPQTIEINIDDPKLQDKGINDIIDIEPPPPHNISKKNNISIFYENNETEICKDTKKELQ